MTKSPSSTEGMLHNAQLLAVLAYRKRHANHPAFPGDAYPTVVEEMISVWSGVIERGYAEIVKHPRLAVRITPEGEKFMSEFVYRRKKP